MSRTYTHRPVKLVGPAETAREYYTETVRYCRPHPMRSYARKVSNRSDRNAARQTIRAGKWDDLTTYGSMNGTTRNATIAMAVWCDTLT